MTKSMLDSHPLYLCEPLVDFFGFTYYPLKFNGVIFKIYQNDTHIQILDEDSNSPKLVFFYRFFEDLPEDELRREASFKIKILQGEGKYKLPEKFDIFNGIEEDPPGESNCFIRTVYIRNIKHFTKEELELSKNEFKKLLEDRYRFQLFEIELERISQ